MRGMTPRQILALIAELFEVHGREAAHSPQGGRAADLPRSASASADPPSDVDALSHALQCAQLAEWAHADAELVAAALLHDLGHLVDARARRLGWFVGAAAESGPLLRPLPHPSARPESPSRPQAPGPGHECRALQLLGCVFPEAVTEPIRLHVQAKRFLVGFDRRYLEALSTASLQALSLQGGPMTPLEQRRFEQEPHAPAAIKLRIWDDLAHHPRKATPPLSHYLTLLDELAQPAGRPAALPRVKGGDSAGFNNLSRTGRTMAGHELPAAS